MRLWVLAGLFAAFTANAAAKSCDQPQPVANYLRAHVGWRLLEIGDLVSDDQSSWRRYHKRLCPGLAEVKLDGSGKLSYAIALVRRRDEKSVEEVILLKASSNGYRRLVILPQFDVGGVVVWRAPPGKTSDWEGGPIIRVAYDSIIVERMEAAAQQFYFKNGMLRMVQTSD